MKKLSLVALVALATISGAIDLTDYTVVDSHYEEAFIDGKFDWKDGNQDEQSYDGEIGANYETIFSTAPMTWGIRANADGEIKKGSQKDSNKTSRYAITVETSFNKYLDPDASKLFMGIDLDLGYRKNVQSKPDDGFSEITVSVGYGRIYVATPLAKAIRIVNDLRKYNQITKEPSKEYYMKLAKLLDYKKEREYISGHGIDEYKKFWFKDIADVLKEAGVLVGNKLGAFGVIKIDEILGDSGAKAVGARKHGMEIKVGISKELSDYDGETDDGAVKASFEYAKPYGLTGQFTNLLTYKASLEEDNTGHTITDSMSYLYELNDKIDWQTDFYYKLSKEKEGDDYDKYGRLKSGYLYHLTNRLDATADLILSKADSEDDMNKRVAFGVKYRLK